MVKVIKENKILKYLLLMVVIAFIAGLLFISILDSGNRELIRNSVFNYFQGIKLGEFNYFKGCFKFIEDNLIINSFIWVLGISIIGIFFVIGLLIFRSFLIGFSFMSIIYTYRFKGILIGVIYIIPEIINLMILFLLVYYSVGFSIMLFRYLFKGREVERRVVVKRYLKVLLISMGVSAVNCLISVVIIPNILRVL